MIRQAIVFTLIFTILGSTQPLQAQSVKGLVEGLLRNEVDRQANARPARLNLSQRIAVQRWLNKQGYNAGTPDGVFGPQTKRAIARCQSDRNQKPTGTLTVTQYNNMVGRSSGAASASEGAVSGSADVSN